MRKWLATLTLVKISLCRTHVGKGMSVEMTALFGALLRGRTYIIANGPLRATLVGTMWSRWPGYDVGMSSGPLGVTVCMAQLSNDTSRVLGALDWYTGGSLSGSDESRHVVAVCMVPLTTRSVRV